MHSTKDLENRFSLSHWQASQRIDLIDDYFNNEVKRGQNSQYWLTDSGMAILDRMLQLEKCGHGPFSAIKAIQKEVEQRERDMQIQQLSCVSSNSKGFIRRVWEKVW